MVYNPNCDANKIILVQYPTLMVYNSMQRLLSSCQHKLQGYSYTRRSMLGSIQCLEPWMHSHVDMVAINWVVLAINLLHWQGWLQCI